MKMNPQVRAAVAEIDPDIARLDADKERLTNARAAIVDLYGGDDAPITTTAGKEKKNRVARQPRGAATANATASRIGRAPTAEYVKLMAATRTAAEPFTAASLCVATGLDAKYCANKLWKWEQAGFVKKVARGTFQRTSTFPTEAAKE